MNWRLLLTIAVMAGMLGWLTSLYARFRHTKFCWMLNTANLNNTAVISAGNVGKTTVKASVQLPDNRTLESVIDVEVMPARRLISTKFAHLKTPAL